MNGRADAPNRFPIHSHFSVILASSRNLDNFTVICYLNYAVQNESSFWGILPIFRGPFLEQIAHGKHHSTMRELGDYYLGHSPLSAHSPLKDWFEYFYSLLLEKYRCEYVYKNIVSTSLYLDRVHEPENSLLTSEFRSGSSRADTVILNGTSTVYEIKSKYDSLARLDRQITDYQNVFDRIFVVTSIEKVKSVLKMVDPIVGIMVLDESCALKKIRDAQSNKANTDPATIFDCMRRTEFCSAVKDAFGYVPDVPNSKLYLESRKLFCQLDPNRAHDLMVDKILARRKQNPFSDLMSDIPNSLKHACISFSKSQALAFQIKKRLEEPLSP